MGDGRWEMGDGRSEVGGRRSEVGGRRSEVGGRRSEVGGRRSGDIERRIERQREAPRAASPYRRLHFAPLFFRYRGAKKSPPRLWRPGGLWRLALLHARGVHHLRDSRPGGCLALVALAWWERRPGRRCRLAWRRRPGWTGCRRSTCQRRWRRARWKGPWP
jgi:hypothetical protein